MSWQAYVDTNLVGTGKVAKAAILGHKGGLWASSGGYKLSPQEQTDAIAAFGHPDKVQEKGIVLSGKKFFTIQTGDRSVYGKKGGDGCLLVKTKQAILVAEYIAPIQAPEATLIVESLADYLISVGY